MLQSKSVARQDLIQTEARGGVHLGRAQPSGNQDDHAFAGFIRAVGRGKNLSRSLSEAEAAEAMGMILDGQVEAEQIGAFLIVLRYRGETPQELAGFVRAVRDWLRLLIALTADLDWPSHADQHRQLPYFALAALLLAEQGIKVAMHGIAGAGRVLVQLGETRARGRPNAGQAWRIAVPDPRNAENPLATIDLADQAVATSSGHATRFEPSGRHHHLFDPRSGRSAGGSLSVSVIAERATLADVLSTTLAVAPPAMAKQILASAGGAEALFVLPDGGLHHVR